MAAEQDIRFRGDASDAVAAVEELRKALGGVQGTAEKLKGVLASALDADSKKGSAEAKQFEQALHGIDAAAEEVKAQLKDAYAASSKGGVTEAGQMKRALETVGATAGLTQKQIKEAYSASSRSGVTEADQLAKALQLVDVQAGKMKRELKDAYNTSSAEGVANAKAMDKAVGGVDSSSHKLHGTLGALKIAGIAAFVGIGAAATAAGAAIVGGFAVGINEMRQHEEVMAAVRAHIESTGAVAGVSAKHVNELANSILKYSGADDEAVAAGESMLLTFKNIRNVGTGANAIFDRATVSLVDMATAMNHGATPSADQLTKSAIQMGKALNDPIKGMTALRRVGVTFSSDQQELIKHLVATGDVLGAQKIILKELESEFGGTAKAAGQTLPGQLHILKEAFNNDMGEVATKAVPLLVKAMGGITEAIPALEKGFHAFGQLVFDVVTGIGTKAIPVLKSAIEDLPQVIDTVKPIVKTAFDALATGIGASMQIAVEAVKAFGPALAGVAGLVTDTLDGIAKQVEAHKQSISIGFGSMGEAIQKAWTGVEPTARAAMEGIVQAVGPALNAFKEIGKAVEAMVVAFGQVLGPLEPVFILLAKLVGLGLIVFFESVALQARAIAAAFQLAGDAAQFIWEKLGDLYDVLRQVSNALGITDAIKAVGSALQSAGQWVADFAGKLGGEFMDALKAVPGAIKGAFDYVTGGGLQRDVTNGLKSLPGLVLQLVEAAFKPSTYTPIIHGAFSAITELGGWIKDKLSGLAGIIKGVVGNALDVVHDWVYEKALQVVLKLIEPFTHLPWKAGEWARDLKGKLQTELNNVQHGTTGPAHDVGLAIGNAMKDGIITPVEKAAIAMVKAVLGAVQQVQQAISGFMQGGPGSGGTGTGAGKGLGHGAQADPTSLQTGSTSGAAGKGWVQPAVTLKGDHVARGGFLPAFPKGTSDAHDYMEPVGTIVRAPESGTISRLTGAAGSGTPGGPAGFSLYFIGDSGVIYYMTHLLETAGTGRYAAGAPIAVVGPHVSGSHVHVETSISSGALAVAEQSSTRSTAGNMGAAAAGTTGANAPGVNDVTQDPAAAAAAKKAAAAAAAAAKKAAAAAAKEARDAQAALKKKLESELKDAWGDFSLVPPEMKKTLERDKADLSKLLDGVISPADRAKFKKGLDELRDEIKRGVSFEDMVKSFEGAQKAVEALMKDGFFSAGATQRLQGDIDNLVALKKKFLADGSISESELRTYRASFTKYESDLRAGFAQVGASAKKAIADLVADGTLTPAQGAQLTKSVAEYMNYLRQAWKDHRLDPDEIKKLARLSEAFDLKNLIAVDEIKRSIDATMKQIGTLFAQGFISLEDYIRAQQWEKRLRALIAAATGKNSPGGAMITPEEMKGIQKVWDDLSGIISKGADDALMNAEKLKYLAPTVQPSIDKMIALFREGVISEDDFNRFVNIPQEIQDAWADGIITPEELANITGDIDALNGALKQGAADLKANQKVWADLGRDVTKAIADNWLSPSEIEVIRKKGANLKGAFKDALDEALGAYDEAKSNFESAWADFKQTILSYFDEVLKPKLRLQIDTSNAQLDMATAAATINSSFNKLFGSKGIAFDLTKPITAEEVEAQFAPVYAGLSANEKKVYDSGMRLVKATQNYWKVISDPNSTQAERQAAINELANAGVEWQNTLDAIPPDDEDAKTFSDGFGLIIGAVQKGGEDLATQATNSYEKATDQAKVEVGKFIDGIVGQLEAGTITWDDAIKQIGVVLESHGIDAGAASELLGKAATDPLHKAFGALTTAIGNLETTLKRIAAALEQMTQDSKAANAGAGDAIAGGAEEGADRLEKAANRIVTATHTINGQTITGPGGPVVDGGDTPTAGGGSAPPAPQPGGHYVQTGTDPDTGEAQWTFVPDQPTPSPPTPVSPNTTATTTTTTTVSGGTGHYEDDGTGNMVWVWDTQPTVSTTTTPPPGSGGSSGGGGRGPQLWTGGMIGALGQIEAFARGGLSGMVRGAASKGIDTVLARLTPGELVLNGHQQRRLGAILGRVFGGRQLGGKDIFRLARGYADGGVVDPAPADPTRARLDAFYAQQRARADFIDPTLQGDLGGIATLIGAPMGSDPYSVWVRNWLLAGGVQGSPISPGAGFAGTPGWNPNDPMGAMYKLMYELSQRSVGMNPLIYGFATSAADAIKLWNERYGFRPANQPDPRLAYGAYGPASAQAPLGLQPGERSAEGPTSEQTGNALFHLEQGAARVGSPTYVKMATVPDPNDPSKTIQVMKAYNAWTGQPIDLVKQGLQPGAARDLGSGVMQINAPFSFAGMSQYERQQSIGEYLKNVGFLDSSGNPVIKNGFVMHTAWVSDPVTGAVWKWDVTRGDPGAYQMYEGGGGSDDSGGGGGGGGSSSSDRSSVEAINAWRDAISWWNNNKPIERALGGFIGDALDPGTTYELPTGIAGKLGGWGALMPPPPYIDSAGGGGMSYPSLAAAATRYVGDRIVSAEQSPYVTPSWAYRRAPHVTLPRGVGRYARGASGQVGQYRYVDGAGGGVTYHVEITVQGSVVRDRELVEQVRDGLTQIARRNGDVSGGLWGG